MRLRLVSPYTLMSDPATFSLTCYRAPTSITTTVTPTSSSTCPQTFTFSTVIAMDGPGTFTYQWDRSNGVVSPVYALTFDRAGTQTVTDTWTLPDATVNFSSYSSYSGWERLRTLDPQPIVGNQASFILYCYGGSGLGMTPQTLPSGPVSIPTLSPTMALAPAFTPTLLLTVTATVTPTLTALGWGAVPTRKRPGETVRGGPGSFLAIIFGILPAALPGGLTLTARADSSGTRRRRARRVRGVRRSSGEHAPRAHRSRARKVGRRTRSCRSAP